MGWLRSNGSVYVAANGENRVVIYQNPASAGSSASLGAGPGKLQRQRSNCGGAASASTLSSPSGVSVYNGHLFVADTQNNRVLVWDSLPTSMDQPADLVPGLADFTSTQANQGARRRRNVERPVGRVRGRRQALCDGPQQLPRAGLEHPAHHQRPAPADLVIGQPDLVSNTYQGPTVSTFSQPYSVYFDGTRGLRGREVSGRVSIWDTLPAANGAPADAVLGQSSFTGQGWGATSATSLERGLRRGGGRGSSLYVCPPTARNWVLAYSCAAVGHARPGPKSSPQPRVPGAEGAHPGGGAQPGPVPGIGPVPSWAGEGAVEIRIYGLSGSLLRSLDLGSLGPGDHSQALSLDGLAAGLYLVELVQDGRSLGHFKWAVLR